MRAVAEFVRNDDLLITERAFLASAKYLLEALSGPRGSFLVGEADDATQWTSDSRRLFRHM